MNMGLSGWAKFLPIIPVARQYNLTWLYGDLITGITVALVLIPQSLSYAQIATLPVEYGLYSAFAGVIIYTFFATSKDVTIGPVAVMSLTMAQIIKNVQDAHRDQWEGPQIATTLALLCGLILFIIGTLRLGWVVEFIPAPAIGGFMAGSAITIVTSQIPGLLGVPISSRGSPFEIVYGLINSLLKIRLDAVFGVPAFTCLYLLRFYCDKLSKQHPKYTRYLFFLSVVRHALVIVVFTTLSWILAKSRGTTDGIYPIRILQDIPRGFRSIRAPAIDFSLVQALGSQLPVACLIILLEHIAITKSFARNNNYRTDPNQELVALGFTNSLGTFFSAYPMTASFSRSALKSATGVYTPISGLFTSVLVLLSITLLTPAFYYIPIAALNAVIIHAVLDIAISSIKSSLQYWHISRWEGSIWALSVLVTLAHSVEWGIWTAVGASLVLMLVRISSPRGRFLGKVTLHTRREMETRVVFLPFPETGSVFNPNIKVDLPAPGVVIYRLGDSCTYPNAGSVNSDILDYVKRNTNSSHEDAEDGNPTLRAMVLDFSAVANIDATGIQALIDTKKEVEAWAGDTVQFQFASVLSPTVRSALVAGGFGIGEGYQDVPQETARAIDLIDAYGVTSEGPLSHDTPFFHVDLFAAVRAAEITSSDRRVGIH